MEIYKVKNYKQLANELKEKTGCDIVIKLLNKDHVHYQLNKMGLSLGILCVDRGQVSFAPFVTHDTVSDNQYINLQYLPLFDDFVELMTMFKDMFVDEE